jgi:hypothetical protein
MVLDSPPKAAQFEFGFNMLPLIAIQDLLYQCVEHFNQTINALGSELKKCPSVD